MVFWIVVAFVTACVSTALIRTLLSNRMTNDSARDIEVYRRQLDDFINERGGSRHAEGALERAEIARRLLRASDENRLRLPARPLLPVWRQRVAMALSILLPVISVGAYLVLGAPQFPSVPRIITQSESVGLQVAAEPLSKFEDHLRSNPNDGRSWDSIAPIFARLGRLVDAKSAYTNAIRLLGSSAARQSGLGEVLVMINGGRVTDLAKNAFETALKLEPNHPKSSFYLAMALSQGGHDDQAIKAFREMEKHATVDAFWLPSVRERIVALEHRRDEVSSAARTTVVPPKTELLSHEGTRASIDPSAMVSRLDADLRKNPQDIERWKQLVRSYAFLKEQAKAQDALARALKIFAPTSDAGKDLLMVAADLGVSPDTRM